VSTESPLQDWQPRTSAELCLLLIMTIADEPKRLIHVRDFCRLYEIKEKVWALAPPGPAERGEAPVQSAPKLGRIFGSGVHE
jgi:hypothetical protein